MTPWQQHLAKWNGCTLCRLCEGRTKMCFARGTLPCDVLFVGEAPGDSEDVFGIPFKGPAGRIMDEIIKRVLDATYTSPENRGWDQCTYALTNLVCCFPAEEKKAGINEPPTSAIEACAPRLREMIGLAKPKLIVMVGKLAQRWVPKVIAKMPPYWRPGEKAVQWCSIAHPASMVVGRVTPEQHRQAVSKAVVQLVSAVERL